MTRDILLGLVSAAAVYVGSRALIPRHRSAPPVVTTLRGRAPSPSRLPTVKDYAELRDRLPCLPDDATMSADHLAETPFRNKEGLSRFVAAHPSEAMATYSAVNTAVGVAVREAKACLSTAGATDPLRFRVEWTMDARATELVLSQGRVTDVQPGPPARNVARCLDALIAAPLRAEPPAGRSFIEYSGPYGATITTPPRPTAPGGTGPS
jgi:hypothetical protein